jgi:hypothetical protein
MLQINQNLFLSGRARQTVSLVGFSSVTSPPTHDQMSQAEKHLTTFLRPEGAWVREPLQLATTPRSDRVPGFFSAVFLIFNRVIGSGCVYANYLRLHKLFNSIHSIYATPSLILHNSGSVGVALLMWLAGASIAALGTMVYIELGTVWLMSFVGG